MTITKINVNFGGHTMSITYRYAKLKQDSSYTSDSGQTQNLSDPQSLLDLLLSLLELSICHEMNQCNLVIVISSNVDFPIYLRNFSHISIMLQFVNEKL